MYIKIDNNNKIIDVSKEKINNEYIEVNVKYNPIYTDGNYYLEDGKIIMDIIRNKKLYLFLDEDDYIISVSYNQSDTLKGALETKYLFSEFMELFKDSITDGKHKYINGEIVLSSPSLKESDKQLYRDLRDVECFPIINRGTLWYSNLTEGQQKELSIWYNEWLNVTETFEVPKRPNWLK